MSTVHCHIPVRFLLHEGWSEMQRQGAPFDPLPVEPYIDGTALVDTGAEVTLVDPTIAERLGWPMVDRARLHGIGDGPMWRAGSPRDVVLRMARIAFDGGENLIRAGVFPVLGDPFHVHAILGHDFLDRHRLFYDGALRKVTVSRIG